MPRNRTIYQAESVAVSPSPATGNHFSQGNSGTNLLTGLYRIQNANYGFNITKQEINQFGELAALDRVVLESPTVSLDFQYILANFANEKALGFVTNGTVSAISGILNKTADERNYFIKSSPEGVDSVLDSTSTAAVGVIGIGNGFMSSYAFEASVGNFPTVSINVEGLNMVFNQTASGQIPAVDPENGNRVTGKNYLFPVAASSAGTGDLGLSTIRPGDITLSFYKRINDVGTGVYDALGASITDAKIQSCNLSFSLSRESIQRLGSKFSFSREITFPVNVELSVNAVLGDLSTGSLSDILNCGDDYDVVIDLRKSSCAVNETQASKPIICRYTLKSAELISENFTSAIGSNKTVALNFMTQLGGPNQSNIGLFMSGVAP